MISREDWSYRLNLKNLIRWNALVMKYEDFGGFIKSFVKLSFILLDFKVVFLISSSIK
jgi:hypothetical protein